MALWKFIGLLSLGILKNLGTVLEKAWQILHAAPYVLIWNGSGDQQVHSIQQISLVF